MNTYEQAVEKVVNFWIDKSFRTPINQDNGDDSEHGAMVFSLMNLVSVNAQKTVSEEKIKAFKCALTEKLISLKDSPQRHWLDVDYHPCEILYDAAVSSHINPDCFPCKTTTRIGLDNIATAKYQYGGKWHDL